MNAIRKQMKVLFLCLCILFLAGCAGKTKSENLEWRMKDCEVEGLEGAVMEIALISGQEFYVISATVSEDEVSQGIYYVNLDTKRAERIPMPFEKHFYVTDMVTLGGNKFAALLSERDVEGNAEKGILITADRTGKVLSQRNIPDITGGEDMLRLLAAADGKILPVTAGCVYCLDENLSDVNKYETTAQIEDAVILEGCRVICLCTDERERANSKVRFCRLDLTKGVWEKDLKLNLDRDEPVLSLMNGRGSSFFLSTLKGLYECDEGGGIHPVLNYAELSLSADERECLAALPEEGFLGCRIDYDQFRSTIGLLRLEAAEKQANTLVIGGVSIDDHIVARLQEYTKKNPNIKVEIKEYKVDQAVSYPDACSRLYADILAGNGPDIIYLQGLDYNNLIRRGYLENLDAYFEKDAEISKEDMIPSFRDAISVDGSMYYLASDFTLMTLAGKTSLVGDSMGWTMKELQDLWKKNRSAIMPEDGQPTFRALVMGLVQEETVDMEDFRLALEMAKRDETAFSQAEHNAGLKNDTALLDLFGINQPSYLQVIHAAFDEEEITLKGFPGVEGSGAMFTVWNALGISSKSNQKDAAWKVVRLLMLKEYQSVEAQNIPYFPTRRDCFEETLLEYTKEKSNYNFELGTETRYYEDTVVITALSKEDVERLQNMVYDTRQLYFNDTAITNIVYEESKAYFSGDRDLEAVCELIRNRIELYRKEK